MENIRKLSLNNIFVVSLILTFVISIFSVGFYHPDEQYYAIDFAALKLGLITELSSWEHTTELRPWSLPGLFLHFLNIFKIVGLNAFDMALGLRLISAVASWFSLSLFTRRVHVYFNDETLYKIFALFLNFAFFVKFMQVRTSSENWSTVFLLLSLSTLIKEKLTSKDILLFSLLSGLSFLFRHQLGFFVLSIGLFLIILKKVSIKDWLIFFCLPQIGMFLLELGIDSWGYGHISFSPWNYVYQNIILDKVSGFGTHPFYHYIKMSITKLGLFGVLMWVGLLWFLIKRPKHLLTWSVFLFILIHHLIGHKELRFLYPVTPVLTLMGFLYIQERSLLKSKWFRAFLILLGAQNLILLTLITFKPAYTPLKFYEALADHKIKSLQFVSQLGRANPSLELKFYLSEKTELVERGSIAEVLKGFVLTTKYMDLQSLLTTENCDLLYSTYPKWLFKYNYGGWRDRSNIWAITNCR